MTFRLIKVFLFAFFSFVALAACENKKPTTPKKDIDKVAKGLEKSTDFERDTIRKDAVKIEKENLINPNKVMQDN